MLASVGSVTAPIDPTSTSAWSRLTALRDGFEPDLRGWFAADADRAATLTRTMGDLHVDLSKNLVTPRCSRPSSRSPTRRACASASPTCSAACTSNTSEDRAVLHTALRRPAGAEPALVVDGQQIDHDVHEVLDRLSAFADRVRSGEWRGVTGKKVTHVVNIGIGGSDLGPVMVYEALLPYADAGIHARFVSNIDPTDIGRRPPTSTPRRRCSSSRRRRSPPSRR